MGVPVFIKEFSQDIRKPVNIRHGGGFLFTGDADASTITVRLYDGENEYPMSGTVALNCIRADGSTLSVAGTVSGNTASATLVQACCAVPGPLAVVMKITADGAESTILKAVYTVDEGQTDTIIDPGTIIPDVASLINAIETAIGSIPSDYSDLLHTLAGDFSATENYRVGNYVWYNGVLYRFKADHTAGSWTGTDTIATVIGDDIYEIRRNLADYSTYPISSYFYSKNTGSHNGVTYTWGQNGKCTVTGTATSTSVNILFNDTAALPYGIEIGKPYILNYITDNTAVKLSIACYTNSTTIYYTYEQRSMFIAPAGTVGMAIRLYVSSGTSFSTPAVVSCVDILSLDSMFESFRVFKNAMSSYNSLNLLANGNYINNSSNGISFRWNEDMTVCTANGTNNASTASLNTIFDGQSRLPDGITAGNEYYLKMNTSSPDLRVRIYYYKNGVYSSTVERNADSKISVPADATGMSVFVSVPAGASVSNATIGGIAILSSESNDALTKNSLKNYEPTGATFSVFSDMPDMSYWIGQKSYIENGIDGDVVHLVAGWSYFVYKIKQLVCIVSPAADQFYCGMIRYSDNHQYWSDLTKPGGDVYNNYYTTEHYENTYTINCSPTITTDTNNYLASTGDTTDRTGDIQTLLNTTGTCHLGPGVFYVTGIDIPNLSSLIGSGNKSQVILASSVTSGYAIKLQSYSQVKDVYIKGSASSITPTSTVETRHGILFEGTANAENPTTYYRSRVEGCTITDFTGGGITCNNTGLDPGSSLCVCNCQIARCGAGINLQYFTEFHRITNVTAQKCYYGCIDNGGNNNFANCDFSMNKLALLIDNSTDQSRNNTHGTFSCCTFQHSDNTYSGGVPVSVGTAIKILKAISGEVFVGCQIGYGDIEVDRSVGIRFDACNIIRMTAMRITNSPMVVFSDCTFWDSTENPLTESGNTALIYDGCYTRLGAVFDPMQ